MPAVLFVCLGNICRSPLAEAALRATAARAGLRIEVDSAGTGDWHVGHPPDPRARAIAAARGVDIGHYKARQVTSADFHRFTHVIALDGSNLQDLQRLRPADSLASLSLLFDHVAGREGESVADPYYGDAEDFAITWNEVMSGATALVARFQAGESG